MVFPEYVVIVGLVLQKKPSAFRVKYSHGLLEYPDVQLPFDVKKLGGPLFLFRSNFS